MPYLDKPLYLDADAVVADILAIPKTGFKANPNTGRIWAPVGVTWHNTGNPSLGLWAQYSDAQKLSWGANLNSYYRGMGWHAPPHAVGTPSGYAIQLGDWQGDGVHSKCFNADHYGIETVGNFCVGGDDPTIGAGLAAMQSSGNVIAALCLRFGWEPRKAVNFHRECEEDHHACPGSLVTDDFAWGLVEARMAEIGAAKPAPAVVAPPAALALPQWPSDPAHPFFTSARTLFALWRTKVAIPFALAMVTQAEFESAFEPQAVGDQGSAFNLYQWHWLPRGLAIKTAIGVDIRFEHDFGKIVDAAWWELNHTHIAARDAIAAATSAADAARAACTLYEGAGAAEAADRRAQGAERWSVWFARQGQT